MDTHKYFRICERDADGMFGLYSPTVKTLAAASCEDAATQHARSAGCSCAQRTTGDAGKSGWFQGYQPCATGGLTSTGSPFHVTETDAPKVGRTRAAKARRAALTAAELNAMVERAIVTTDEEALHNYLNVMSHFELVRVAYLLARRLQHGAGKKTTHKHFCIACSAVIGEGDFDCETDSDHDYELCDACADRIREGSA